MADAKDESKGAAETRRSRRASVGVSLGMVRTRVAQLLWIVCVAFALVLAVGALSYALEANADNDLVDFVRTWANRVDLGVFSLEEGIKEFRGKNSDIKNALFNWGLGAVFWLVLGRILDRVVRP